jgi:hypothetical protein
MGVLLAFAFGYVVGGKAGKEGLEEVANSLKAVRESPEFRGLLKALRSHASYALRELSEALADTDSKVDFDDLLARVRALAASTAT